MDKETRIPKWVKESVKEGSVEKKAGTKITDDITFHIDYSGVKYDSMTWYETIDKIMDAAMGDLQRKKEIDTSGSGHAFGASFSWTIDYKEERQNQNITEE